MEKLCWWLVWWNWKYRKATLAKIEEVDAQITLTNGQSPERYILKRKDPSKAIHQLCIKNDLLGKQSVEYKGQYSTRQYPLACTSWSKKADEKSMSPFLNAILPKLGLNRHFPRVVIHGSRLYGGFQMAHFYIKQRI
eukprot:4865232-Ditylum_brightwellii.AAC.2